MSITPTMTSLVASPRPQYDAPMSWQLNATVPCIASTVDSISTVHGTTGFSGTHESKRLEPGSFAGGLT